MRLTLQLDNGRYYYYYDYLAKLPMNMYEVYKFQTNLEFKLFFETKHYLCIPNTLENLDKKQKSTSS